MVASSHPAGNARGRGDAPGMRACWAQDDAAIGKPGGERIGGRAGKGGRGEVLLQVNGNDQDQG